MRALLLALLLAAAPACAQISGGWPIYDGGANTLAQRNGANAQTFRIYNTFTDSANYERVSLGWSGNVFSITPEAAGTGTLRTVSVGGAPRVLAKGASANASPIFSCAANVTQQTALTVAIPGNTIGTTGALRITIHMGQSGAGSNTIVWTYGGTQVFPNAGFTATVGEIGAQWTLFNRTTGAQNGWLDYIANGASTGSGKGVDAAVDSTVSQNLVLLVTMSAGTNTCALESYIVELLP